MLFLNILRILVLLHLKTPNVYDKKILQNNKDKTILCSAGAKIKKGRLKIRRQTYRSGYPEE